MPETKSFLERARGWAALHPLSTIGIIILFGFGPFLNKAIHIDDTLFVLTAEHILKHPGDFYGFSINWTNYTLQMSVENCNPPTVSYFFAGVMAIFGTREIALHAAMLLLTFAAAAGLFQLARLWCQRPLLATVVAVCTPVFLVSGTTLMCDMPMLAALIWTVVFWERALQRNRAQDFFLAGVLGGLAVLTKYSAVTLLPLLFVLGAVRKRRLGWWLVWLALPVGIVLAYEYGTARLYGAGLISSASKYAAQTRFAGAGGWPFKLVIGTVFLGACLLPVHFFAYWLWTKREMIFWGLLIVLVAFTTILLMGIGREFGWWFRFQMGLMLAGGIHLFLLAGAELWRRRDAVSLVLALWLGSGFAFAAVLNWTVSARSFLPFVPAAAILVVGRLPRAVPSPVHETAVIWPLGLSFILGLLLCETDFQLANSGRAAAKKLASQYNTRESPLWFEGHRGFQYYLQKAGAKPVDFGASVLKPGELMVVPSNGNTLEWPSDQDSEVMAAHEFPIWSWLTTVNAGTGAGFYGAGGLLPFVFGSAPVEQYFVCRVLRTMSFAPPEVLNNLAWRLATDPDANARDGATAVELAKRACEMSRFEQAIFVGTLAAAYAEAGQFDAAVLTAQQACDLAAKMGETNLVRRNKVLGDLYRAHKAYRELKPPLNSGNL